MAEHEEESIRYKFEGEVSLRIVVVLLFNKETANVKENWEEREMRGGD